MPHLVEVAVHRAPGADDPQIHAGGCQLGGECLAGGAKAVEFGVDHEHGRKAGEVVASRERVAAGVVVPVLEVVAVDDLSRFRREDPGGGDIVEEPGQLVVGRQDAVMQRRIHQGQEAGAGGGTVAKAHRRPGRQVRARARTAEGHAAGVCAVPRRIADGPVEGRDGLDGGDREPGAGTRRSHLGPHLLRRRSARVRLGRRQRLEGVEWRQRVVDRHHRHAGGAQTPADLVGLGHLERAEHEGAAVQPHEQGAVGRGRGVDADAEVIAARLERDVMGLGHGILCDVVIVR